MSWLVLFTVSPSTWSDTSLSTSTLVLDVTTVFPFLHPTKTDCASTQYYTPHKDWLWKYTVLYTPQKLTMDVHSIIHPTMTDHASTQYYTLTCALRIFPHQWWQTHRCQRPCWFPWSPRLYHLTWGPSLAWYQSLQGPANRRSKGSLCILCLWLEAENRSLQRRVIPCNESFSNNIRLEIWKFVKRLPCRSKRWTSIVYHT